MSKSKRERTRRTGRFIPPGSLAISLCFVLPWQVAQAADPNIVAAAGSGTTVTTASSGAEVVKINAANAAGLSINQFDKFNVGAKGAVLNNSIVAGFTSQAGWQGANGNLKSVAAKTILAEVVRSNPSNLTGTLEVFGKAANVVLANPYGIVCNGGGFINAPKVDLVTGSARINASTGALSGYQLSDAKLEINGKGLTAKATDLGLASNIVLINGPLSAKILRATAARPGDTVDASLAPDTTGTADGGRFVVTEIGSMYADRISIVSTNTAEFYGKVTANDGDITITAANDASFIGSKLYADDAISVNAGNIFCTAVSTPDSGELVKPAEFYADDYGITRTAKGHIFDNGTILNAWTDINQSAGTIVSDGFSFLQKVNETGTTKTEDSTWGIEWTSWLPNLYWQYSSREDTTTTTGEWQALKGSSFTSRNGSIKSCSTGDSIFNGATFKADDDIVLSGASLRAGVLEQKYLGDSVIDGFDATVKMQLGFFWLQGACTLGWDETTSKQNALDAIPSTFTAGRYFKATVPGALTFVGSKIDAGWDATFQGDTVNFASYTASLDQTSEKWRATLEIGGRLDWIGASAWLKASGTWSDGTLVKTYEIPGSITTGDNLYIRAGSLALAGTNIQVWDNMDVQVARDMTFSAVGGSYDGTLSQYSLYGKGTIGLAWLGLVPWINLEFGGQYLNAKDHLTTRTGGVVNVDNNLSVTVGGDASFEGTRFEAGNNATLKVGGNLNFTDAVNELACESYEIDARVTLGVAFAGGAPIPTLGLGIGGSGAKVTERASNGGTFKAGDGWNLDVEVGKNASFTGTELFGQNATLKVGGNLNMESGIDDLKYSYGGGQFNIGLDFGGSSVAPSFGIAFNVGGRELHRNDQAVVTADDYLYLTVGGNTTLAGGTLQAYDGVKKNLGGMLTVTQRKDYAFGGGVSGTFGTSFIAAPRAFTPASSNVLLPGFSFLNYDQWKTYDGGFELALPSGYTFSFGAYADNLKVEQKKSGIFTI